MVILPFCKGGLPEHPRSSIRKTKQQIKFEFGHTNRIHFLDSNTKPESLFNSISAVSTVTGSIGFEAFLGGVPVICFGSRFYSKLRGVSLVTKDFPLDLPKLNGTDLKYRLSSLAALNEYALNMH